MADGDILVPTLQALVALERQMLDAFPKLKVYPLQPRARPTQECIWNWLVPDEGGAEWVGTGPSHRDVLVIRATIAVAESADDQAQAMRLLELSDAFLRVIDPGLNPRMTPMPLGGCARNAKRLGMHTALYRFDERPPLLAMDFPIEVQLDRNTFG
jgi:hypothetical protein